ncbi:MAG: S-adenosylmethionine decarboxylase [Candidatus Kerfeldbacteria bacterium]|nr:S-adenosylmethionine decarboxylase [Candidatus Kerfeldbacteria bacterium]
MKPDGIQLVAELSSCRPSTLGHLATLERIVTRSSSLAGLKVMNITSYVFRPGITLVAILSQSHLAFHTYPEARHLSLDVFTCGADREKIERFLQEVRRRVSAKTARSVWIQRGTSLNIHRPSIMHQAAARGYGTDYTINKRIFETQSRFQNISIIENELFGRMLFLDGELQIASSDHAVYERALVDPLYVHTKPADVLVLGGGDGGVARELLQRGVRSITVVEIDPDVVQAAKKYLPTINHQALSDYRVRLVYQDVRNFLTGDQKKFDGVVYDLTMHPEQWTTEPRGKYLTKLFRNIFLVMKPGASIALQCGSGLDPTVHRQTKKILNPLFSQLRFYPVDIPSYCEPWLFASARRKKVDRP